MPQLRERLSMTEANSDSACLDRLSFRPSLGRIHPSVLSVGSVVKLFLLFRAEFLESGIGAQRVPDRIEPKKSRRNRRRAVIPATVGRL
jgi:hypothetical protein